MLGLKRKKGRKKSSCDCKRIQFCMDDDLAYPGPTDSGWLIPDGSFVMLPDQYELEYTHEDLLNSCSDSCDYWDFQRECGAMRIRAYPSTFNSYMDCEIEPTKEQFNTIREIIKSGGLERIHFSYGGIVEKCSVKLDNPRPMDIRKIKRCFE